MSTNPKDKKLNDSRQKAGDKKPQRNFLLLKFSVLSFIAFIIIGYVVISTVKPALEGFTIREHQSSTVVFVNRHASQVLTEDDFRFPLTQEQEERMKQFVSTLSIKGSLRIFIINSAGTVIYAQPSEYLGASFSDNPDVKLTLERRKTIARFENIEPEEQKILGVQEAFVQSVPITFGTSPEVTGVVYSISRVGILRQQIKETQQEMAIRIIGGLFFLYALLFVIVWQASRTIRKQSFELELYTRTLEQRVRERTRKLEQTTKQQVAQAKEVARLKDEFTFIAAHELKAPITNLKWTLSEFFSDPKLKKEASPIVVDIMHTIQQTTEDLISLIADLLDVARLERGTIKISVHPTDLVSALQEIVLKFQPQAKKQGVQLVFHQDAAKKLPFALSDSERLKEIFSNLISNALKFNKKNGKIDISVEQVGDFLEARVTDTGIGINKKDLSKLFTKFWRIHPEIEGTGLGLWITRELVTRMNGTINVQSKEGEGSTFIVSLPIAKPKDYSNISSKKLRRKPVSSQQ